MTSIPLKGMWSLLVFSFHLQLKLPRLSFVSLFSLRTKVQLLRHLTLQLFLQKINNNKKYLSASNIPPFESPALSPSPNLRFQFRLYPGTLSFNTLSAVLSLSFINRVNPSPNHLLHPLRSSGSSLSAPPVSAQLHSSHHLQPLAWFISKHNRLWLFTVWKATAEFTSVSGRDSRSLNSPS